MYTYEDWYSGKICLFYTSLENNSKRKKIQTRVVWDQILKDDILKIREEQKIIFEELVIDRLDFFISIFIEKANDSEFLIELINEEIFQCREIMFGKITKDFFTTTFSNITFTESSISEIQGYIKLHKVKGKKITFEFIHSPNCIGSKNQKQIYQIEAEAYFRFYTWLKGKKLHINNQKEVSINKKTWRDDIFIDEQHYNKGLEIISKFTDKKAEVSSHSFVYHIFKKNNFLKDIKQKVYIQFLEEEYSVKIKGTKISSKKPAYLLKLLERDFPGLEHY